MLRDQLALLHRLHEIKRPVQGAFCRPANSPIWQLNLPPQIGAPKMWDTFWPFHNLYWRARDVRENPVVTNAG